ncbi:MAG: DUF2480 family protein [Flavitalea sp.]
MSEEIINKVAQSALTTIDLETLYPKAEIIVFDLKPFLFMEMIIKEKDFRASLLEVDWTTYQDKKVAVTCSADAIIPMWAYMLVASYLQPVASEVFFGTAEQAASEILVKNIRALDSNEFADKRIVVKGCGELGIGPVAYLEITTKLRAVAKSIMYGEPCSTVPIYKKK